MITTLNPEELHRTPGYHHVTIVDAGRLVFLAGQCPLDRSGAVPTELDAQVDQIVANSLIALAAAGAAAEHVVRSVVYVASTENSTLAAVWRRLTESALRPAFSTASTLLGVAALGFPGQLVELDLTAALPATAVAE